MNDANNHSFDFGAAGQAQTVRTIHAAGLAQTGLPGEITVVKANGIKVAFVAFAPYAYDADLLDLPAARSLIERATREAELVVVYMHAGAEGSGADHVTGREEYYLGEDRGNPEAFAHMAIDAGASVVIASGPHVVRGMQFYKGHLIAYSLGNFAGYGDFATSGDLDISVILHVTLSATGRFESARLYPIQFTGIGRPVPGGAGSRFISPAELGGLRLERGPHLAFRRHPGAVSGRAERVAAGARIVRGMKVSEIRDLIRVKPVELDATRRRLSGLPRRRRPAGRGAPAGSRARSSTTSTAGPTRRCRCGPTSGPSSGTGSSPGRW